MSAQEDDMSYAIQDNARDFPGVSQFMRRDPYQPTAPIPRELSQLAFNARVLQEARDESVPLLERLRFLGIFSSNQDEYYRVRVAAIQRLQKIGPTRKGSSNGDPAVLLSDIQRQILRDQSIFLETYDALLRELHQHGIRIITEADLSAAQGEFVRDYFVQKVRPHLTPIMLQRRGETLNLDERDIYLGVRVLRSGRRRPMYAIVDVPTRSAGRFVRLPSTTGGTDIILLEDVIRYRLLDIFSIFRAASAEGYVLKVTRDSGLDLGGSPSDSYLRKVEKSVKRRLTASLVRFVFDAAMPSDLLESLCRSLQIEDRSVLVPGGRHHNFKDFIRFPRLKSGLLYEPWPTLSLPSIDRQASVMRAMRRRDILIQTPYQRFSYLIDLLREAAIDPKVTRISVTMYRVANNSGVVNALINAARNGKRVTAVVELTARFDETSNIEFTDVLTREGVRVVFGPEDLKIHAKMGLIERKERGKRALYGFIGTGNLNEDTANLYADHFLLTTHQGICQDLARLFRVIRRPYETREMEHLLVSPWTLGPTVKKLIQAEIEHTRQGEPAAIEAKLNHMTEPDVVGLLQEAAEAGVELRLNVRGTFSLPTENLAKKTSFRAISILGRYLEHSRILVFRNGGDPLYYCTSADWMPRNFDRRIEIAFPAYDSRIKAQLRRYLDLQWADNCKARKHDSAGRNERVAAGTPRQHAQESIYRWLADQAEAGGEANIEADTTPEPAASVAAAVAPGREAAQPEEPVAALMSSAASASPPSSRL